MIEYIIYSVLFVIGTLLADYLSSIMFDSSRKIKQIIFEVILFIIISNYLLLSTKVSQNAFIIAFLYFFYSFLSMIFSRVIGFLIFDRAFSKMGFKKSDIDKNAIKLAMKLSDKMSKREIMHYFSSCGFSKDLIDHLDKVLEE